MTLARVRNQLHKSNTDSVSHEDEDLFDAVPEEILDNVSQQDHADGSKEGTSTTMEPPIVVPLAKRDRDNDKVSTTMSKKYEITPNLAEQSWGGVTPASAGGTVETRVQKKNKKHKSTPNATGQCGGMTPAEQAGATVETRVQKKKSKEGKTASNQKKRRKKRKTAPNSTGDAALAVPVGATVRVQQKRKAKKQKATPNATEQEPGDLTPAAGVQKRSKKDKAFPNPNVVIKIQPL